MRGGKEINNRHKKEAMMYEKESRKGISADGRGAIFKEGSQE